MRVNKESEPSDRMSSEVSANFQADRQMSVVSSLFLAARPLGRRLCRRLGGRSLDIVSLENSVIVVSKHAPATVETLVGASRARAQAPGLSSP